MAKKNGGKFVTINLQNTKHVSRQTKYCHDPKLQEKKTDIPIHGKVDDVMRIVVDELGILQEVENEPIVCEVRWKSEQAPFVFSKKRKLKKDN